MFFSGFGGDIAKYCDAGVVLFEVWKIFEQRLNTLRGEEDQHVVEDITEIRQVA